MLAAGDCQYLPAGPLTPSVVMSLGLGAGGARHHHPDRRQSAPAILAGAADRAPSFYFIDIPTSEADRFGAFLKATAPQSTVEDVPMLRGRIVAARGVKATTSSRRRIPNGCCKATAA